MNKYLLIAISSLLALTGHPQSSQTGTLTVCGRWEDYRLADVTQLRMEAPAVMVYDRHLKADLMNHQSAFELDIRQDSFFASIPLRKPSQYISFDGLSAGGTNWLWATSLFLATRGDSVHLSLQLDSVVAIRSNNPLLDFQFQLARISNQPIDYSPNIDAALRLEQGLSAIHSRFALADSISRAFVDHTDPYAHALSVVNFRYGLLKTLCQVLNGDVSFAHASMLQSQLPDALSRAFAPFLQLADERMATASSTYLSFQFYYHLALGTLEARLGGFTHDDHLPAARLTLHRILEIPSPILRDQVLLGFFKNSRNVDLLNKKAIPLLEEALQYVRDREVHEELQTIADNLAGGDRVPDIDFFDRQGNPVGFGDFPGKVVLAHFWYRGCAPCAKLSSELHPVVERYQDREDVVFLNINVDRAAERWEAGLDDGKYHSVHEITLHTGSAGMSHPFLQHYGFKSFPQVVLADQRGKLVSLRTYAHEDESEGTVLDRLIVGLLN